jgi:hypothetical protein
LDWPQAEKTVKVNESAEESKAVVVVDQVEVHPVGGAKNYFKPEMTHSGKTQEDKGGNVVTEETHEWDEKVRQLVSVL